jgi:hypothetical protein
MLSRFRRPSHGTLVAYAALFIALGGTSYAVTSLPKNSVGTSQIKTHAVSGSKIGSNAVTTSKVKNGSLRAGDFKAGSLPAGAAGPQGPAGPAGAAGSARAYGRVETNGVLITPRSKNIQNVTHPFTGVYCIQPAGVDVNTTGLIAIPDPFGGFSVDANPETEWDSLGRDCPGGYLEVKVFVNGSNNKTAVGDGGTGTYFRYNHVLADGPFFFMIP